VEEGYDSGDGLYEVAEQQEEPEQLGQGHLEGKQLEEILLEEQQKEQLLVGKQGEERQQEEQEGQRQSELLERQQEQQKRETQQMTEHPPAQSKEQPDPKGDFRHPTLQEAPLKDPVSPKDLRYLLRRTVSGIELAQGKKQEPEKPKDLRLMLRRTQSGVSLTEEGDLDKRPDVRPQLRGPVPALTPQFGGESCAQLRGPSLSPRPPRENIVKADGVPNEVRCLSTENEQESGAKEKDKKASERSQLRRNTSGSDREDEEKKNPRLQFRRTVSAPSLKIPRERKRLIHCTGKKRIYIRETDPVAGSLNNHDVYNKHTIFST
jgi:hypothetical protein